MSGFLLDTNVVSELMRRQPEPRVAKWVEDADEETLYLSVLTVGEIRSGIELLPTGLKRQTLETWLSAELPTRFFQRMLSIDEQIADRWGRINANALSLGRPLPDVDGLIAATALRHNLVLVTRNVRDVTVTGVPVLNPWEA